VLSEALAPASLSLLPRFIRERGAVEANRQQLVTFKCLLALIRPQVHPKATKR
jgi:hypothetical protein